MMMARSKQLIWLLPLALAGLVALLGWWGNGRLRDTIDGQLKAQLSATLNANVTALGIWTTNQTRLATSLAEDPTLRTLAGEIFQLPPPVRRIGPPPAPTPELQQFATELRPRLAQLGYETAQLVNTNFMVVASSRPGPQGGGGNLVSDAHTNKFAELFESGEPVIITPFKPDLLVQRRFGRGGFGPGRTNILSRTNNFSGSTVPRWRMLDASGAAT